MITEKDLQEAIAECEGQRNPNANTCVKLAAFYIIKDHLFPQQEEERPAYSFASLPQAVEQEQEEEGLISYGSETEFGEAIAGKTQEEVWPVVDEAMSALQLIQPRLYDSVIRKLRDT